MATLKSHGKEIGRIDNLISRDAFMSDGKVLRDRGDGWKLYRKFKAGINPTTALQTCLKVKQDYMVSNPWAAAYKKALHNVAAIKNWYRLHSTIELMPEDPDGVWSECCDNYGDNVHASMEEIGELCKLYKLAVLESKELKAAQRNLK